MAQPSMLRHEYYALEVEKAKTPGWRRRKELDLKSARIDVSFDSITIFSFCFPRLVFHRDAPGTRETGAIDKTKGEAVNRGLE